MEILKDTIIQLVVRQGSDSERKNIVFKSGEPAFTEDTNRLFIGDGVTNGGKLVGNLFKGSSVNILSLAPAEKGDLVYNEQTNTVSVLNSGDGTLPLHWKPIANLTDPIYLRYDALSATGLPIITKRNIVSVETLSTGHYKIQYNNIGIPNPIPIVQILGLDWPNCQIRTLYANNSACEVKLLSTNGTDANKNVNFILSINY